MPTDRALLSAITHGDRPFHNPVDPAKLDWLLEDSGRAVGPRVDVGCGPGELLVRLAERAGAGGLGVDLAAAQIEEARRRAAARAPGAALAFAARDAEALVGAEGGFALAACLGSTHALGGPERALGLLAGFTRPGGWVLIGEGYGAGSPRRPTSRRSARPPTSSAITPPCCARASRTACARSRPPSRARRTGIATSGG